MDAHFGVKKTLSVVQGQLYWKGIAADVNSFVKCCDPYQCDNPQLMKVPPELHHIQVMASFWHQVGVDLCRLHNVVTNTFSYVIAILQSRPKLFP